MSAVSLPSAAGPSATTTSPGLEWLWQELAAIRRPHLLDCGPVRRATVETLLTRAGRLYRGDLVTPLARSDQRFWNRTRKVPVFRTDEFLTELPVIPAGSLSAVFCWQLFDLLPRDALAAVALQLYLALEPKGVLFCVLREPRLAAGAAGVWSLAGLTRLARDGSEKDAFPFPALTNREVEQLIPTGSVKTFLTRSGWREVLAIK